MYPKITDGSNTLAILNNITKNNLKRRINNKYIFKFKCYEEPFKTEYIQDGNMVEIGTQLFDIAYIGTEHDIKGIFYDVECEHVTYRLLEDKLPSYAFNGTPTQILTDLLSGTDFTVGTVDFVDSTLFAVNQSTNKLDVLQKLAATLGGELDFSGYEISLLTAIGADNGFQARIKKNLGALERVHDKRIGETSYAIDLINIFESEELKGLKNLENAALGDTIKVIDEVININTSQRVIEVDLDVIKNINQGTVLSNAFLNSTDLASVFKSKSITKDQAYYGVRVNDTVGLEIERYDLLARTILNADEFRMQKGDGLGSYEDSLYFDPLEGVYKFIGDVIASNFIGGTIDIGSGTFFVDSLGNMTATSATITGTVTGSSIIGGDINIGSGNFVVNSAGDLTANSASIVGTITGSSIIGGTIDGADVYGARYFGFGASTAYMEIGAGGGNLADFSLNRSATDVFFEIEDGPPGVFFKADASVGDTTTFLSSYDGSTTMYGTWSYGGSQVASRSWVSGQGYITGTSGFTGSFTNGDGNTVTVDDGLIKTVA